MKRFILIMLSVMLILSMTIPTAFANDNGHSDYFDKFDNDDDDIDYSWNFNSYYKNWKSNSYYKNWKYQPDFNDLNDFDWAKKSIKEMSKFGVIRGIGNGKYVPNRSANKIEVIIMILRLTGATDDLDKDANLPRAYNGKKPDKWMIPYIALAFEEGILDKDNTKKFNPKSSASRQEAAMYIMSALEELGGFEDELERLEDWFDDVDDIDNEYEGYVKRMRYYGFMIGFNHKFQPNKSISRAECAVLMNRIFNSYEFKYGYGDNEYVTGELVDVDFNSSSSTDNEIEIRTDDGTPEYDLDEDVKVYDEDNKEITLRKLDKDYKEEMVKLTINDDDLVIKILVLDEKEPVADSRITGTLDDFDYEDDILTELKIKEDGDIETFEEDEIDEDVEILINNNCDKDADDEIDELKNKHKDLKIKIYLEDGDVVKILLYYDKLEGELAYDHDLNDGGSVDIIPEGESSADEFDFDEDIEIFMNGDEISESEFEDFDLDEDIEYEVEARLLGNGDIIGLCISYDEEYINSKGTLLEFDYDNNVLDEITLEDDGDETFFNKIDEDIEILVENNCDNDAEDEIDKLNGDKHIGLEVEVTMEDGKVVEILVYYKELEGELEYDNDLEDNRSVDIIPEGKSNPVEVDFDEDIEIFINGEEINESEYENFDMDHEIEYDVEARLLANDEIISLCISYDDN